MTTNSILAIHAFTVAALLCALVSRVTLALERAFRVDASAVGTQPDVLTLIDVCLGEKRQNMQSVARQWTANHSTAL